MAFTSMIDFKVFIFSLCIGLFLAYITSPELDTIVVYPNQIMKIDYNIRTKVVCAIVFDQKKLSAQKIRHP